MRRIVKVAAVAAVVTLAATVALWAAITPYFQDFEGLVQADPNALANDGWLVYGAVFDNNGVFQYGYGPFGAPNDGGPAFCAIVTGEGGAAQGMQQLSVYSDYNNGDHGNTDWVIETNVFQEQTIEAGDVGAMVDFSFEAKLGNLEGVSEAEAFIKTLDPANNYATTNHIIQPTTATPTTWTGYSIQLTIDAGLVGQILQFGFTTRASNYQGSGVFYDNINQPVPVELMSLSVE
jgi:hypothetical protein